MQAPIPAAAITAPAVAQLPGSVRVTVLVKQRDRASHGQIVPDAGAVVLLIPKGVRVDIPWPAVVPGNCLLMRRHLPLDLQRSTFAQAQSQLRKSGGYAAATGAAGEAFFPTVVPGDFTVLVVSNSKPYGIYMMGIRQMPSHYPGLEVAETLLDRHFGLGIGDSHSEEVSLRLPLRSWLAHEGELSVLPGEEMPYSVTF